MKISRKSPRTGKINTWDVDVTQEQLDELAKPKGERRKVQEIVPNLNEHEREFLLTGFTIEDWDIMFKEMTDN